MFQVLRALPAFVDKFDMKGARSMKSAAGTVSKRLRDEGCLLADQPNGVGRPSKAARVIDLKRCYGPHGALTSNACMR